MKDIKAFLESKFGKPNKVDELKQKAKGNVLSDFKDAAKQNMADSMDKSMKKVTIIAKDPKDLKKGLQAANEVVSDLPESDDPQELADELLDADDCMTDGSESHVDMENKDERIAKLEMELEEMREAMARVDNQSR